MFLWTADAATACRIPWVHLGKNTIWEKYNILFDINNSASTYGENFLTNSAGPQRVTLSWGASKAPTN
jgi:hypothetical protein